MKIVVTGAAGMLGSDVVRVASGVRHEVVALGHDDVDVTNPADVERTIDRHRPGAVINCAAWTDVDGAEQNEREAALVNGEGAGYVAGAAAKVDAKVLYVSTDYVFDGGKRGPYLESDETAPIQAYGRSKLAGERATALANERSFIVRSSWLFGIGGRNFVETMLQLAARQPEVLVVSDQVGCPTYTVHLADGIARLIEGEAYGIHHMAASGSCSWYEFAQEIFDQSGVECRVMAATTEMLGRDAPRPPYSVLESERPDAIRLPIWREGLSEYLRERESLGRGVEAA